MCNSKFTDHFNCYLPSFIAHFEIHWSEMKSTKEHKKPGRNGTMQSWLNKTVFLRKWKEGRRDISTGTWAGTRRNQEIKMEQNPLPDKRKKGDKHRNQNRNQKEPGNHDGTKTVSGKNWEPHSAQELFGEERREKKGDKHRNPSRNQEIEHHFLRKEERRRETSTGTRAGTNRNQEIMVEQNAIPEKRKKRGEEGKQAPEPELEPEGTRKSWWNRTPFRRKERREKKGDKHRNPSRNQETEHHFLRKEEWRRETSTGTRAGTTKSQDIMMERNPFPEKRKKREERETRTGTRAGTRRNSKSWWNKDRFWQEIQLKSCLGNNDGTDSFLSKERRDKKWDKPWNHSRNQQEAGNHGGKDYFLKKTRSETRGETRKKRDKKRDQRRNQSRNQQEAGNNDGTKKDETRRETRRETSPGTKAETRKKQKIMMEQRLFLARIPFSLRAVWGTNNHVFSTISPFKTNL